MEDVTLDSVWAWDHRSTPVQATYAEFRELMGAGKEEEASQIINPGGMLAVLWSM